MFIKAIKQEMEFDETSIPACFGKLDREAFKLSNIQDKELRLQLINEKINQIKEICKTNFPKN